MTGPPDATAEPDRTCPACDVAVATVTVGFDTATASPCGHRFATGTLF